jgi:hypothetical protein
MLDAETRWIGLTHTSYFSTEEGRGLELSCRLNNGSSRRQEPPGFGLAQRRDDLTGSSYRRRVAKLKNRLAAWVMHPPWQHIRPTRLRYALFATPRDVKREQ